MPRKKELTEEKALEMLEIPDWRHMSKDKVMAFMSEMPQMSTEVAKSAMEQFPQFTGLCGEMISAMKDSLNSINAENSKSSDQVYEVNMRILNKLEIELDIENSKPLWLQRQSTKDKIIDKMLEVESNIEELDKRNKNFLQQGMKTGASFAAGVVTTGAAILGARIIRK